MDDPSEILLVEDNQNDVELILAALGENQIADEVFVARDGEEALDYLQRRGAHESRSVRNPKVVLLDLQLPRVEGLEVLQRLKSDPDLTSVPMVMLTYSVKEIGRFWGVLNQAPGTAEWKG